MRPKKTGPSVQKWMDERPGGRSQEKPKTPKVSFSTTKSRALSINAKCTPYAAAGGAGDTHSRDGAIPAPVPACLYRRRARPWKAPGEARHPIPSRAHHRAVAAWVPAQPSTPPVREAASSECASHPPPWAAPGGRGGPTRGGRGAAAAGAGWSGAGREWPPRPVQGSPSCRAAPRRRAWPCGGRRLGVPPRACSSRAAGRR